MLNDTEIDMEELEARLYGQVHHGNYEEEDPPPKTDATSNNSNQPPPPRYFTNFQPPPNIYNKYESYPHPAAFMNTTLYSQLGLLLSPAAVNNIVVVQQPPQLLSKEEIERIRSARQRNRRRKERRKRLFNDSGVNCGGFKKHRLSKNNVANVNEAEAVNDQNVTTKDASACEIIEPIIECVVLTSSDDEDGKVKKEGIKANEVESDIIDNTENSDDVIFVETKPDEVINIDCDDEVTQMDCTASPVEQNDFLENSILPSIVFVDDVDLMDASTIQQTSVDVQVSDSETSVTTSDTQNHIFKESAFEVNSKDPSSLNLDDFENYISTSGKFVSETSAITLTNNMSKSSKVVNQHNDKNNGNSSDSSSESEYEDDVNYTKTSLGLPNLSPIDSDDDVIITDYDNTIVEIDGGRCETIPQNTTTIDVDTSIVCISSSDNDLSDISDTDVGMDDSIEVVNIETPQVFPKQEPSDPTRGGHTQTRFANFWTDDMKKFYRESWGQENFSCEEEQKKMSDEPTMWKIIDEDRTNSSIIQRGIRCHRCRQFGHKAIHCPNKSGIPKCILCGHAGHYESNCPNKLCIACGNGIPFWTVYCRNCSNLRYSFCDICRLRGHTTARCTDLWRRYHLTVSDGPIVRPTTLTFKSPEDRWCCGCAWQGHYEHECHHYIRPYSQTTPFVQSYGDVYKNSNQNQDHNIQKERTSPTSLNLKIDKNVISQQQQQQTQRTQFVLPAFQALRLLDRFGIEFLKSISRNTNLKIKVFTRGDEYVCMLEGSEHHKAAAVSKIEQYCITQHSNNILLRLFGTKFLLTKQTMMDNFKKLKQKIPWDQLIKEMYNEIEKWENDIKGPLTDRSRSNILKLLESNYMALNAVLISKYNAGEPHHLKLLKKWTNSKAIINENVQQAYDYIFSQSRRANIDYKNIIGNLLVNNNIKIEINALMRKSTERCKKFNLHKERDMLEDYYHLILDSQYRRRELNQFRKLCNVLKFKCSRTNIRHQ